jgi:hypothetical protein
MSGGATTIDGLWTTVRLLTFQAPEEGLLGLGSRLLAVGPIFAWACGVGRFSERPRPHPLQAIGLGSVVEVIASSLLLGVLAGLP